VSEQGQSLVYESGQWQVHLGRRELLASGITVPIGSRAFGIIEVLVQSANELVTKDELMRRVWSGVTVDENTLAVHISAIRKALGRDRAMLRTASGRGYRLLGNWRFWQHTSTTALVASTTTRTSEGSVPNNLPHLVTRLVGRATAVQRVRDLASAYRVVTLTGPGGIGKTTLALEAARGLLAGFNDGGWLVELASLSNPALVPSTVANALGLTLSGEVSVEAVARAIGTKHVLLVLDNCEHLIDAAALLVDCFVRLCPHTSILATSREILSIDGEAIYRVRPLDVPAPGQAAPANILGHSAVELFIARADALDARFSLHGEDLASVAAICRHLDGIPLAIEFAAAAVATLGIAQVASGLRYRFTLLTQGRRTALARQKTLRATLDWSYRLLSDMEQRLLRRLSVFPAGFTPEAVAAVMEDFTWPASLDGIASLVTKSLIVRDQTETDSRWRLLETIRAYAAEKLVENAEAAATNRRQAEYCRDLLASLDGARALSAEQLGRYAQELDNARAALDWAFSLEGDPEIGIPLTLSVVPLWMQLSLVDECRQWVERALTALQSLPGPDPAHQMRLDTALADSLGFTKGLVPDVAAASARALETAQILDSPEFQLRALYSLWTYSLFAGELRRTIAISEQFRALAAERADVADQLVGERIYAVALHYIGDQINARAHLERMLSRYVAPPHRRHVISFQRDQGEGARLHLARTLWLQGFADQALQIVHSCVGDARAAGHISSLCRVLGEAACPIALEVGDLGVAAEYVKMMVDLSTRHALVHWKSWGRSYEAELAARRGDAASALQLLRTSFAELANVPIALRFIPLQGVLALALGRAGQVAEGLAELAVALEGCKRTEARVGIAELLRIKADLILLHSGIEATAAAEALFHESSEWARRQGALSWELRAATSFARLRLAQGRLTEARQILSPVYDRFTEGFGTADMLSARQLLEFLSGILSTEGSGGLAMPVGNRAPVPVAVRGGQTGFHGRHR
jgi:predicted ATPase/DNA-binding winged helix-turn-helix (wHTH) protein